MARRVKSCGQAGLRLLEERQTQLEWLPRAIEDGIDSSKFKAVNSRDRNFTPGKVDKRQEQIEQSIQRYLTALATADRTQPAEVEAKTGRLRQKIATLREQMQRMDTIRDELQQQPDGQLSLTDSDARAMISQAKGTGVVGYNVQTVVDTAHHLIVTHEVTNVGSDRAQLAKMGTAAKAAMGKDALQAVADRGYFSGPEIKACTEAGIVPLVPKPMTGCARAEGRFSKADFVYSAEDDAYRCPAGERASYRMTTIEHGLTLRRYWSSACPKCPLKARCTPANHRRVTRWEHEAVLEDMQRQLDRQPEAMTLRRCTVEHVFGTLKCWMGATHFLTRGLEHVGAELALHVLAYNFKRVLNLLGMARTMEAVRMMGA